MVVVLWAWDLGIRVSGLGFRDLAFGCRALFWFVKVQILRSVAHKLFGFRVQRVGYHSPSSHKKGHPADPKGFWRL